MKKEAKKNKIVQNDLKDLLQKFLQDNTVDEILKHSEFETVKNVPLTLVEDNHFLKDIKIKKENIESSKKSIKSNDIITPLIVRKNKGKFELIRGRDYYFALLELKVKEVPVLEISINDEGSLLILMNDLKSKKYINFFELSECIKILKENYHYSNQKISNYLNISIPQVINLYVISNSSDEIKELCKNNKLSYSNAKILARLNKEDALLILEKINKEKISAREVERLARISKNKEEKENLINENDINNLSLTLNFNDKKDLSKGIKEINTLIKKGKIKIK